MENIGKSNILMRHGWDTILEYDAQKDRIFIHCAILLTEFVGNWISPDELTAVAKNGRLFGIDYKVWDRHLTSEALKKFCESENQSEKFVLRFMNEKKEMHWHEVVIERSGKDRLILLGRNIYDRIIEMSVFKAAERVYDSIVYIDADDGSYIVHYTYAETVPPSANQNYDEMIGVFVRKFMYDDDPEILIGKLSLKNVKAMLENDEKFRVYSPMHEADGRITYKKFVFSYLDDDKKIITLIRMDISDIAKEYERKIRKYKSESYNDALTNAYNRKYYEEKIRSIRMDMGVAVIDMDDFKLCNDIYGHNCGDIALVTVVGIIKKTAPDGSMIIRYGGDEFLLIVPDAQEKDFGELLDKIRRTVRESSVHGYPGVRLSVSIGGVIADNETADEAVVRADKLMYNAKNVKNMVVTENNFIGDVRGIDRTQIKQQVLVVDDSEMNRAILSEMLGDEFRILEATDGEEALDMLNRYGTGISCVLLDIVMPVMDGFEVLAHMNKTGIIADIPVIMISGEDSDVYIRRAYALGVSDYVSRPFDSKVVYRRVYNTIALYSKQRKLITLITNQAKEKEKNSHMMIDILSRIMEFRNGESGLHVIHMNLITGMLLEELIQKTDKYNLSWNDRSLITTAASLHDIGKIAISDDIINKPGKLTAEEFEEMKKHTVYGEKMLKELHEYKNEKIVKIAAQICRWHHERYDGKGYPDGLKGDDIPIGAQVVALADVYDALISKRVYKAPYSHDTAVAMIIGGECGVFNPILIECLGEVGEKLRYELEKKNFYDAGE